MIVYAILARVKRNVMGLSFFLAYPGQGGMVVGGRLIFLGLGFWVLDFRVLVCVSAWMCLRFF